MGGPGPGTAERIALSGHLDGRCTSELRALLTAHLAAHGEEDLRLDMSAVESVDLTVLRLLAALAVRLRRDGHQLVLVGCTPSVRRLLTHGIWRRLFVVQRTPSSLRTSLRTTGGTSARPSGALSGEQSGEPSGEPPQQPGD